MNLLIELAKMAAGLYAYCTDFIINLANLMHLSYYEVNTLIFIVAWPIITVVLLVLYFILKIKLSVIKKRKGYVESNQKIG